MLHVQERGSGAPGALKQLHDMHLGVRERRFRLHQEVAALRALGAQGTPALLDSNAEQWEIKGTPLYVVMDWIDGETLAARVQRERLSIDEALLVTRALLTILRHCHAYGVYHRDVKPDNVVLRAGVLADPVLVDFGMAWSEQDDTRAFTTDGGQELGNRFLRLPEHAAGAHLEDPRDPRSDFTMLVGLLLFMLTGRTPRLLRDAEGHLPHERPGLETSINAALGSDPRAQRLRSLFTIGFQYRIDQRFQNADALLRHLDTLEPTPMTNDFDAELDRLQALFNSEAGQETVRLEAALQRASEHLYSTYMKAVARTGLVSGGSHSVIVDNGARALTFNFFLVKSGTSDPKASFTLMVRAANGTFVGSIGYEHKQSEIFYTGADVDEASLHAAIDAFIPVLVTRLVVIYREKFEALYRPD